MLTATRPAAIWLLPAVFAAWANLHGGWIVGGAVLGLWTAGAWIQQHSRRWQFLVAGLGCLVATLLNPEGWGLWKFLLETVRIGRENIIEWQPIWVVGIIPVILWLLAAGLVVVSLQRRGRPPLPTVLPLLFLAVTSMQVIRLLPLFALAAIALLGAHWSGEDAAEPPAPRRHDDD